MQFQTPRELAALIRSRRKQRGWSQSQLAERAGVSRDWIIGLEKGRSTVEFGLVLRTIKALGLSFSINPTPDSPPVSSINLGDLLGDHENPTGP
jgi:HTH-type transcriptional regulator/antitoxin HipB